MRAARGEVARKLSGVESVAVNLATEQATVRYNPAMVGCSDFGKAVERAGYGIRPDSRFPTPDSQPLVDHEAERRRKEIDSLRLKFIVSLAAGLLIMALMFLPLPWPMEVRYFAMFLIATPVQFWAGWQFYKGAWHGRTALHHQHEHADRGGHVGGLLVQRVRRPSSPAWCSAAGLMPEVYYDTSTLIIALILMGRYLEARAKGRTSEAIKKLMGLARAPRASSATAARRWTCRSSRYSRGRRGAGAARREGAGGRRGAGGRSSRGRSRC